MNSDTLIPDDIDGLEQSGGASSNEDFWMFFSFAMILLVFVLMNYVNYLNSMVVKAPTEQENQQTEVVTEMPTEEPVEVDFHLLVETSVRGVRYRLAEDPDKTEHKAEALEEILSEQVALVTNEEATIRVYVHAAGDVLYKDVFNASYAAWQVAEQNPALPIDVHLVYEDLQ